MYIIFLKCLKDSPLLQIRSHILNVFGKEKYVLIFLVQSKADIESNLSQEQNNHFMRLVSIRLDIEMYMSIAIVTQNINIVWFIINCLC